MARSHAIIYDTMCFLSGISFLFGMYATGRKYIPIPREKDRIFQMHSLVQLCEKRNLQPCGCGLVQVPAFLPGKESESFDPSFLQQHVYELSGSPNISKIIVVIKKSDILAQIELFFSTRT